MLADSHLAQITQDIGLLSLGASDEQIERLSTVYWFIIEFGLCLQFGQLRAIGAGLLSAFGELQHACSDVPGHEQFDPEKTSLRPYQDFEYQPVYFVADSIIDAMERVKLYARSLCTSRVNVYDPVSRSVTSLSHQEWIEQRLGILQTNCNEIRHLLESKKEMNEEKQ